MNGTVLTKTYKDLPFCEKEILRYSGCKVPDENVTGLMDFAISGIKNKLSYRVCYIKLSTSVKEDVCDFGLFSVKSGKLSSSLEGCRETVLFAATIGAEVDRLISGYGRISPSKALMFQAIGAERIETLCDFFCEEFAENNNCFLTQRFSPGYGDLPLETQKEIFRVLNCSKHIGLTLNDSLLMSPTKSVTAFAGITDKRVKNLNKCLTCDKNDCIYRGVK